MCAVPVRGDACRWSPRHRDGVAGRVASPPRSQAAHSPRPLPNRQPRPVAHDAHLRWRAGRPWRSIACRRWPLGSLPAAHVPPSPSGPCSPCGVGPSQVRAKSEGDDASHSGGATAGVPVTVLNRVFRRPGPVAAGRGSSRLLVPGSARKPRCAPVPVSTAHARAGPSRVRRMAMVAPARRRGVRRVPSASSSFSPPPTAWPSPSSRSPPTLPGPVWSWLPAWPGS